MEGRWAGVQPACSCTYPAACSPTARSPAALSPECRSLQPRSLQPATCSGEMREEALLSLQPAPGQAARPPRTTCIPMERRPGPPRDGDPGPRRRPGVHPHPGSGTESATQRRTVTGRLRAKADPCFSHFLFSRCQLLSMSLISQTIKYSISLNNTHSSVFQVTC